MSRKELLTPNGSAADLYREAARQVADIPYDHDSGERRQHQACCTALRRVAGDDWDQASDLIGRFEKVFMPEGRDSCSCWYGAPENPNNQGPRVLALCFMAAMVEAGDA